MVINQFQIGWSTLKKKKKSSESAEVFLLFSHRFFKVKEPNQKLLKDKEFFFFISAQSLI